MDAKKLGTSLLLLGVLLLIAAVCWWAWFYAPIAQKLDVSLGRASSCFYTNGGVCSVAKGIAQLTGKTAYSPELAWIGAVFTGIGALMKLSR
jgi:hypothetical protein